MPLMLPKVIEEVNDLDVDNKISCIIVTFNMGWALEVGLKLGIKGVLLWTASATSLACCYRIPQLIHDGIIDSQVFNVEGFVISRGNCGLMWLQRPSHQQYYGRIYNCWPQFKTMI
ncbi:unnamed protein product [Lathyrus sativus]|nr:unnamed protein product [Lathyrus sativus]